MIWLKIPRQPRNAREMLVPRRHRHRLLFQTRPKGLRISRSSGSSKKWRYCSCEFRRPWEPRRTDTVFRIEKTQRTEKWDWSHRSWYRYQERNVSHSCPTSGNRQEASCHWFDALEQWGSTASGLCIPRKAYALSRIFIDFAFSLLVIIVFSG